MTIGTGANVMTMTMKILLMIEMNRHLVTSAGEMTAPVVVGMKIKGVSPFLFKQM